MVHIAYLVVFYVKVGCLNLSWDKAITQLRDIYDGMTSYQQQFVSEDALKTLREYETRMEELKKVAEQSKDMVTV